MTKTTKAQKRAQVNYFQRLKDSGYKRISFVMRDAPELIAQIKALIRDYKG